MGCDIVDGFRAYGVERVNTPGPRAYRIGTPGEPRISNNHARSGSRRATGFEEAKMKDLRRRTSYALAAEPDRTVGLTVSFSLVLSMERDQSERI